MRVFLILVLIGFLLGCKENRKILYSGFDDLVLGSETINLYDNGEFEIELSIGFHKGKYTIQNDTISLQYNQQDSLLPTKFLLTNDSFIELSKELNFRTIRRTDNLQFELKKKQSNQNEERWFYWSVDFHPTKNQFAVGGSNDTFLKLFSSNDFNEVKTFPYKGTITKVKWHPTKNLLALAVQDGKSKSAILNHDNETFTELDSITNDGARGTGWNYSGNILAIGDNNGFLSFFDENGNFIKQINTKQKAIIDLDWHPNENKLVAVGESITLYNYESDSIKNIKDRDEKIEVLMLSTAWHPTGDFFATGDYGDFQNDYPPLLQFWTYDGERIKSIEESKAELRSVKWSPDGNLLATTSEKIRFWNQNGDLIAQKEAENLLWGLDWSRNGNQFITTDDKGKIIFWDENLNRIKELEKLGSVQKKEPVESLIF